MPRHTSHRLPALVAAVLAAALMAADKTDFRIEEGRLALPGPIVFGAGDATIQPGSEKALEHIAEFMKAKESITLLRIEGHTDNQGDPKANQALSEKRALAVAKWLAAHGVDCKRLVAVGFGGAEPVAEDTPEGRSRNRRIEARPAAMRGRPIGGMPVDGGGHDAGDPCGK